VLNVTEPGWSGLMTLGPKLQPLSREQDWPEDAFREVFLEHYGRVTAVLYRLVGDAAHAEELANEVFWRLYQRRTVAASGGSIGGWLYRAATRLGIDALRAAARRKQYEEAAHSFVDAAPQSDPLRDMLRENTRRRVRAVLGLLRPAQAQLLILRASGFSYKELSEILKLKPGSIGTMLIRAETAFREHYLRLHSNKEVL
jgi:RNA polymerase sigma-70 factor, ECF subfamily